MSLFTDPRAIVVSDGESSYESSDTGRTRPQDYAYGRPRRYNDNYYGEADSRSDNSVASSVDELVRHTLHQRYTDLERELGSAAGFYGSPFRSAPAGRATSLGRRHSPQLGMLRALRGAIDVDASRGSSDGVDGEGSDAALARDAAYLQRLHRGLAEMRMRETGPGAMPGGGSAPKKKIVLNPEMINRWTKPNASVAAKKQEKYEKRLEREQAEKPKRTRPSPVSIKAGERLHLQAKALQKNLDEVRNDREKAAKDADEKLTFQPKITALAERLAREGHRDIEDRLEQHRRQQEEMERRRIELQVEEMRKYPFHPRISKGSREMVEERRARSQSRGRRSRSRHSSRSRSKSRSHSRSRSRGRNEPIEDPGERLYRDGGERLLRQQIRQRRAEQAWETRVVGNGVTLSRGKQEEVAQRLEAWQETRERNVAALREEAEKLRQQSASAVGKAKRVAAPPSAQAVMVAKVQARASSEGKETSTATPRASPANHRQRPKNLSPGKTSAVASTQPRPLSRTASAASTAASAPSHASTIPKADPFALFTPKQKALYWELRRLRFGALFYKYTTGNMSAGDTVTLEQVQRMVETIYREDAGVVDALRAAAGQDPRLTFTKNAFITALEDFERAHGPQPWGRTEKDALLFPAPLSAPRPTPDKARNGGTATSFVRSASVPGGAERRASKHTQTSASASSTRSPTSSSTAAHFTRSSSAQTCEEPGDMKAKVAGYATHVARMRSRSHSTGHQDPLSARTYARSISANAALAARRPPPAECTFTPQLSKRTTALSTLELERRAGYVRERELRRTELDLLRVLNSSGSGAAVTTKTPAKPSTQGNPVSPLSGSGSNPSVELSSMSGSAGRSPVSAPAKPPPTITAASTVRQGRVPPPDSAASQAMRDLQALLEGGGAPPHATQTQPPRTTQTPSVASVEKSAQVYSKPTGDPVVPTSPSTVAPASTMASAPLSATAMTKTPPLVPGTKAKSKPPESTGAFSEKNFDELFDAMYRRDGKSAWF